MKKPNPQVLHAFSLLRDPVLRDAMNRPPSPAEEEVRELGDRIESYEDADPPALPPSELVAAFNAAREKAHADRVSRQGTPRINLLAVEPIGTETRQSFVDGVGIHGMMPREVPLYPKSERGEALQRARLGTDVSIGDLARALCVGPSDVSSLEQGAKSTDDAGWATIQTVLFLLASGMEARHIADPTTSPRYRKVLGEDLLWREEMNDQAKVYYAAENQVRDVFLSLSSQLHDVSAALTAAGIPYDGTSPGERVRKYLQKP